MASDDSRTLFDAKVQEDGFDFLNDYLGRILAQTKQPQPIIELVKTPGRRKHPQTKGKSAVPSSSRLRSVLTASIEGLETEDDQTLPPNAFAQALIDAGNEEDTFSRPIPPSAQLVVPTATNVRLSPVVEVSYQAEQVIEPILEPQPPIEPPNASHPDVRPLTPEPELRQEDIAVEEPANGAPLSPPESPMIMSPELPPRKTLPTPPDDEIMITGEQPPPSITAPQKSVGKPVVVHDVFKSPPPQSETSTRPGPLRTLHAVGNSEMTAKTAPLPAPTTSVFTPHPPPTDIPGTRLMRKASAPQLQPNAPTFVREPASQPTPALPKRTSWLTKAREVHQEAKTLTHNKRTEPHPGPSETSATTNHLAKSTKRKPSEVFDGVQVPPRHSGKVQKVTETDVQTNATREQHEKEKWEEKEKENEMDIHQEPRSDPDIFDEEDPLHTLKRTVEGLGFRAGKSMGKSIGGLAAAALAEARATAEARIAEKTEKFAVVEPRPREPEPQPQSEEKVAEQAKPDPQPSSPPKENSPAPQPTNLRASLHNKERVFQPPSQADMIKSKAQKDDANKSNDPTQPTRSILKPPPVHQPVFSKPVFTAPKPKPTSPKLPATTNVGLQPSFPSTSNSKLDDAPAPTAWLLENQENRDRGDHDDHTAFSNALYDTRNDLGGPGSDLDEGDSWHDGDKLNPIWATLNFDGTQRDDEMTWSTIPTQTHTSSTQGFHTTNPESSASAGYKSTKSREEKEKESLEILGSMKSDTPPSPPKEEKVLEEDVQEPPHEAPDEDGEVSMEIDEPPEPMRIPSEKPTVAPSTSQGGILSNALKTVAGVFGAGKKVKAPDPPKSLQLAASLAKKQKEEEEKKVARMKEMELRRQQVAEKKAETERARQAEEQNAKLEAEKKREREEEAKKKLPAKPPTTTKKATEDASKKQKADGDGSSESQSSQSSKHSSQQQSQQKSTIKAPAPAKETTPASPQKPIPTAASSSNTTTKPKVAATPLKKGPPKGKAKAIHDDDLQPSQIVKKDMAARARAKLDPPITSESIQLPEIDSEYSDSDDEDRKKNFDPPDWAQQANVTNALQSLSRVNPDNIFGAVQPLAIEDMFRNRTSRFRARTSSANWNGTDGLTKEEEEDYVRRMGFEE